MAYVGVQIGRRDADIDIVNDNIPDIHMPVWYCRRCGVRLDSVAFRQDDAYSGVIQPDFVQYGIDVVIPEYGGVAAQIQLADFSGNAYSVYETVCVGVYIVQTHSLYGDDLVQESAPVNAELHLVNPQDCVAVLPLCGEDLPQRKVQ